MEERNYKLGEVIIKEGDYSDYFFILDEGKAKIIKE
jgi:CRP-like cAMP-binding protein